MMCVRREEVSFGPSTSANTYVLAQAVRKWLAGTNGAVVVTNQDHEANSGVWRRLAEEGIEVREWKLDPSTGVRIQLQAHRASSMQADAITLDMEFASEGGEGPTPYEVLLHAAMTGQSARFTRQDGVEEAWRIMQPLLDSPPPVHTYQRGSWGPDAADALMTGHGKWHDPWMA